jgi:(p)ppGpp synthase/HD superfamily hydrolase
MRRDTLELACDSLFIEKFRQAYNAVDGDLLNRAYAFAKGKARGPDSPSFQAAALLLDQEADAVTIAVALIAPLHWQGLADLEQIRQHLGREVAGTLEGLSSPFPLRFDTRRYRREDIGALLATMGSNPRTALLLITFRLLALEDAAGPRNYDLRHLAQETLDFYVPIANRLSLGEVRRRLEDACFHILDPAGYEHLRKKVAPIQAEDDKCLAILLAGVQRLLNNNGIQGRVQGRTKSLHAIRRKMNRTGKTLEEIMDRVGLRVIVPSVPQCYAVLGLLHTHFKPIPGTFDDYIGLPKDNGYQSLHTCVYPVRGISHKPIEFQVRTELMHAEAEHGTAAHWRYKRENATGVADVNQAQWMAGLVRQHEQAESAEAFIELLHRQVFQDHLVVFGNRGRIIRLAEKATVQDYLNTANVQVPWGASVKVNGETATMDRPLKDGDSIEIMGGDDSPGCQGAADFPGACQDPFDGFFGSPGSPARTFTQGHSQES